MNFYWLKFKERGPGSVRGANEQLAKAKAKELTGFDATSCDLLPYPATPEIWNDGECPPFCHSPEQCKGRSSCPQSYACSE